jgi:hypothetical protein
MKVPPKPSHEFPFVSERRMVHFEQTFTDAGGNTFKIDIYWRPDNTVPAIVEEIQKLFEGNRTEATKDWINARLADRTFAAIISVRNVAKDDRAIGTLAFKVWCPQSGEAKLWLNDVSRITGAAGKGSVSPTKVLMTYAKRLTSAAGKPRLWLLVDETDRKQANGTNNPAGHWGSLTGLYSSQYGFVPTASCKLYKGSYTPMWSPSHTP